MINIIKLSVLNKAAIFATSARIITGLGSLCALILVPFCLDEQTQGYYFVFQSILGIQVIFELGFSQVVLQVISREWSRREVVGLKEVELTIIGFVKNAIKKYFYIASLYFITVIVVGLFYFNSLNRYNYNEWQFPWIVACFFQAVNILSLPIFSYIEGIGAVERVNKYRLFVEGGGALCLVAAIVLIDGLWMLPLYQAARFIILVFCLYGDPVVFDLIDKCRKTIGQYSSDLADVKDFKWRIALSWASGYFIYTSLPAILFAKVGAIEAGKFAITWSLAQGVTSISIAMISVRSNFYSNCWVKSEFKKMLNDFRLISRFSFFFLLFVFIVISVLLYCLGVYNHSVSLRFLHVEGALCIFGYFLFNQIIIAQSVVVRSKLKEPYLYMSIVGGLLQLIIVTFLSGHVTNEVVAGAMLLSMLMVSMPWAYVIYKEEVLCYKL